VLAIGLLGRSKNDAATGQPAKQLFSPCETGDKLAAACSRCHGPDGDGKMPGTPSLAGRRPRYFATAALRHC